MNSNTSTQRIAIGTGGGSGIGLAIAEKFVQASILTIIIGRDQKKLNAAQKSLGNFLAGMQIAFTQPIRIDDVLVVEGETTHPEVSADGAFAVYSRPEGGGSIAIDVVRVADGTVFPFARGFTGIVATRARWFGATHTIAFRAREADGSISLYAQDFKPGADTTSTRRKLLSTDSDATLETFAISPDGKRAVLAIVDEASGLMMAEGLEGIVK